MRRINKSQTSNALTVYANKNPNDTWEVFQKNNGNDFKIIKKKIFEEQGYICAYCETDLSEEVAFEHHRRVEHFDSKSAWKVGQPPPNLHLDWNNVIGVCVGGTDRNNLERYIMPDNKSCDSYKEHLETNLGHSKKWKGQVLSPLEECLCSDMFVYCLASGELGVNVDYANSLTFKYNNYDSSAELLENTIKSFNLNCERLKIARREIHFSYEKLKAEFRKTRDENKFKFKVIKWSGNNKVISFQTTRDILLRECPVAKKIMGR